MEFPVAEIISFDGNKYELATAMIKYAKKIEEVPELLLEHEDKGRHQRLEIIMSEILSGNIKYTFVE